MASAFPGMDPYLEGPAWWPDFHTRFVNTLSESIADRLPEGYQATLNEQVVLIEPDPDDERDIEPDVTVIRSPGAPSAPRSSGLGVLEPQTIPNIVRLDPHREVYIELRYGDQDVVTLIELQSPSNKSGAGRGQYVQKRDSLLQRRVNIFELDLLRGGTRLKLARALPKGDYFAFISRGDRWPDCQVYAWSVRDPLPTLPVPLKSSDSDIQLPLAEAFSEAYRRGHYANRIRYNAYPPPPAFSTDDARWVREMANQSLKNKDEKDA
jgi:hypothetical protein